MAMQQVFVVRNDAGWKITCNGRHYGSYPSDQEAIRMAVDMARKAGRLGDDAEVLVEGENNQFRINWIYRRDSLASHC